MRAALLAVLVVALVLPSSAHAANVTVGVQGTTLNVAMGGATRVTVSRSGANVLVSARTTDTLVQGAGCTGADGGMSCGAELNFSRVVVTGSSGNDEIAVSSSITRATTIDGNGGDDEIAGGGGADTVDGDNGNDVITGGAGNDDLRGAAGDDVLVGELGSDIIDGGTGTDAMSGGGQPGDTLDYAARTTAVTVDLSGGRSGASGENDAADGFFFARGGSGPDTLIGSGGADRLDGNGGDDVLLGGADNDTLNGGAGADSLDGGLGVDALSGGDGTDLLAARDGVADQLLACGAARDRIVADVADPTPTDCEVIAPVVNGTIAISGEARVGGALSAAFSGGVSGTPSALAWRWLRCAAAGCVAVGEGPGYAPTDADAGAQLVAVLRADNEAGAGELQSALVGPVTAAPVAAAPSPAPAPAAAPTAAVRSVRCSGRRCRIALTITGHPASVRAVITHAGRTIASGTRKSPQARFTLTLTAKRKLKRGNYRLRITAPGTKAVTRTVRIKR